MEPDSGRRFARGAAGNVGLLCSLPDPALAQAASPFMTGANCPANHILAWLTPVAVILVMCWRHGHG